ncbi:MAG: penicillin-binding protein 2, partial [Dehalococcoidia bacterium]|nr:penicillin-binding protein 2 [Dehalococcoidia bacterium]
VATASLAYSIISMTVLTAVGDDVPWETALLRVRPVNGHQSALRRHRLSTHALAEPATEAGQLRRRLCGAAVGRMDPYLKPDPREPRRARGKQEPPGRSSAIFAALRALVLLLFGILIIQLVRLQVIRGDEYAQRAEINALREVQIPSSRGLILDREGRPLVRNGARYSAAIVPGDLPERGEVGVYQQIERVTGVSVEEIEGKVAAGVKARGEFEPVIIKEDIDEEAALTLRELEPVTPGLRLLTEPTREYLAGPVLSHVLGYVGSLSAEEYQLLNDQGYLLKDYSGKTGVELTYESVLRGRPGKKLIEVDAFGRELKVISERRPLDGSNLVLTLDLDLQQMAKETLEKYTSEGDNAAAVVMDIKSGDVLATVSLPDFDNNVFSGPLDEKAFAALVNAPGKPLVNHALAERYPPGSTFKTIVGSAALQEGIASTSTTITSRGYITVEDEFDPNHVFVFKDWAALGPLDFYGGIAMSSDVYFYYLSGGKADEGFRGLGEARVAQYARAFGLGEPTGIDLPGESAGLVPDAEWKVETFGDRDPWTIGDTYNFGIGQGFLSVTPLQLITAVSTIGNGGKVLTPHLLREVQDNHGNILERFERGVRRTVPVEPEYLAIVKEAMRQSVTRGVAKKAAVPGIEIAGKTGTAEFGPRRADGSHETHGWFVGFAPYDDPQVAIVVFFQRGGGGSDAAPAASQILDYYFHGPQLAQKPKGSD